MGAGILGLVTTRGVVARRPLVLGLAMAGRPWPLATLVLRLAIAHLPRVNVLRGAVLVLGVAVATDSVSCPLFACPFVAGPPPSRATLFRTRQTWLCSWLSTGSISNSAK